MSDDTESVGSVEDDFVTDSTSTFDTPNANPATGDNTALTTVYSCVTMIDVKEGDSYVVDLRHGSNSKEAKDWIRFLIDTGKRQAVDDRLGTICGAFYGKDENPALAGTLPGPWRSDIVQSATTRPNIPVLAGVIVTHSDEDHCGYVPDVVDGLNNLENPNVPLHNTSIAPLPLWMSPLQKWTDEIIVKSGTTGSGWGIGNQYFDVSAVVQWDANDPQANPAISLVVGPKTRTPETSRSTTKTWSTLWDLAEQARYKIVARFTNVTALDGNINQINEVFGPVSKKRIQQADPAASTTFGPLNISLCQKLEALPPGQTILVEVGLEPEDLSSFSKRTLGDKPVNSLITGRWLRASVSTDDILANINFSDSFDGFKDPSILTQIFVVQRRDLNQSLEPEGLKTETHVVGLDDLIRDPLVPVAVEMNDDSDHEPLGHFSNSRLGCAGAAFVKDFAHLVLQYRLPTRAASTKDEDKDEDKDKNKNKKKKKKDKDKDEDEDRSFDPLNLFATARTTPTAENVMKKLGWVRLKKPGLWAEYANRASIISHFVYCEQPDPNYVNPSRRPGIGDFNMLFTGDAFEAGRNEVPYTNERKFQYGSLQPAVARRERYPGTKEYRPDGNIMGWLWGQSLVTSLRIDVLKVPHHGSSRTTNSSFFRNISASVYLISGAATIHGHPRAETLETIISTILREDGGARPPNQYRQDDDHDEAHKSWPHISERPRPRLIFMTNQTNFSLAARKARAHHRAKEDMLKEYVDERSADTSGIQGLAGMTLKERNLAIKTLRAQKLQDITVDLDAPADSATVAQKDFQKAFKEKAAQREKDLLEGNPSPTFKSGFRNEVFATDWMRDKCPNLRPQSQSPQANVRIFYQKRRGAATRLKFGRDWYRPHEVRCEWHQDDWVELRYEWDAADQEAQKPGRADPPLANRYIDIKNDPVAYPYPQNDQWEYPQGAGQQPHADVPAERNAFSSGVLEENRPVVIAAEADHQETARLQAEQLAHFLEAKPEPWMNHSPPPFDDLESVYRPAVHKVFKPNEGSELQARSWHFDEFEGFAGSNQDVHFESGRSSPTINFNDEFQAPNFTLPHDFWDRNSAQGGAAGLGNG